MGTDTGGSVRVPASLCGLVGLKVSHGRISLQGVFPLAGSLDTVGPLTATVGDAALAYCVTAGFDPLDSWTVPQPVDRPPGPSALERLRVAVPEPWIDRPLDDTVAAGFAWALERLQEHGAAVEWIEVPWLVPDRRMNAAMGAEVAAVHRHWFAAHPDRYGSDVAARIERALSVSTDDLVEALHWRAGIRNRAASLFDRFDLLATPTTAVHRKPIGSDEVETQAGREPYRRALSWFTSLVNHLGFPALAVPLAAPGRPPPSLQLIGPMWSEARLLGAGMALEDAGIVAPAVPVSASPAGGQG
jgi:aspartyl-tRNA(Asn)/glutamyl-tRNA(Gln) amidotransferase subunit A